MVKDDITKWSMLLAFLLYFSHTATVSVVLLSFVKNGLGILLGKKHPSHHIAVINLLPGLLVLILQPGNGVGWFDEKSSAPA